MGFLNHQQYVDIPCGDQKRFISFRGDSACHVSGRKTSENALQVVRQIPTDPERAAGLPGPHVPP